MNIQKAVKKAIKKNCYIARKSIDNEMSFHRTRIKPTNSYGACVLYTFDQKGKEINRCKNWNPTAEDLLADDWKIFKE
ncbi:MAG: MW1434 family type I TA system toxin [Dorea sp.]|nr:MW1434 family type I TA system toxin [Dorea sp.]